MKKKTKTDTSLIVACLLMALLGFFLITKCSDDTDISNPSQTEQSADPMETKAITMATQIVKVNLHTSSDVDFSNEEAISIGDNAYEVLGHYTIDGVEHKYDLRLHYKGGEWTAISNWEWSRLQLMRVGESDLDEDLHGTWKGDDIL